jgi:multicomponent Na+:H+ antiporter subunit B
VTVEARRTVFGIAAAAVAGFIVWGLSGLPAFGHYGGPYGVILNRVAVGERHATNVVSAVNFDYRGIDTVGEEFILFAAVMGVSMLLRTQRREHRETRRGLASRLALVGASDALRVAGLSLIGPLVLTGIWVVTHGQSTPGGGFQGGLVLAAAPLLIYLVGRYLAFRRMNPIGVLDLGEGAGAGGFLVVGLAGLMAGAAFLENVWPLGQPGSVFSAGTMPVISLSIGLEVAAGMVLVAFEFLEQGLLIRGP